MSLRLLRVFAFSCLTAGAIAAAAPGCASRGPDLFSRLATAKGTLEAVGYKPHGETVPGRVEEGKEQKVTLDLIAGCYNVMAFAGDGLKGLDLALADPGGKAVGQVTKQEGQASVQHCVGEAGKYALTIKSAGGSGSFLVQPYRSSTAVAPIDKPDDGSGGGTAGCVGPDCDDPDNPGGAGTDNCSSGLDLAPGGNAKGSTTGKGDNVHWSCAASDGPAVIYRVHIEGRHKLVVDTSAKFDAVVALYRAAHDGYLCDSINEIECSDDSEGLVSKGHIEATVDTGDYGIIIGGYDGDRGDFEVKTRLEDAPSLDSLCSAARAITPGVKATDSIGGTGSNFRATCATSGDGDENLYKFDIKSRSRVRITTKSTAGEITLSVRNRCDDPSSEVACTHTWHFDGVSWTGVMNNGAYTLIADTSDASHSGTVDVNLDVAPEHGAGTADGDTCKDAKPITLGTPLMVDTFQAKGDAKASCASDGAADVVYKLDVKVKSRVFINSTEDEGRHVVALQKTCGETKGEIACELVAQGKGLDAMVDPGSYFVIVKGKGVDDFGRVKITTRMREVATATAACKAAPKLVSGTPVNDTTKDSPDKFASTSCGGPIATQNSGDKVYQFTLKERSHVNLQLKSGTFYNAIMSLRSDCNDPTKGEIVCSSTYSKVIDRDLDPGTYYVVVDGSGTKYEGAFTLEMTTKPIK